MRPQPMMPILTVSTSLHSVSGGLPRSGGLQGLSRASLRRGLTERVCCYSALIILNQYCVYVNILFAARTRKDRHVLVADFRFGRRLLPRWSFQPAHSEI